ncbi:hypothetical protein AB0C96_37945 [Streptomyces sp. NPDC048506]|uniref:hypothetical protein n=1 Tax=Streptomyces sp. NPDC048506 TaxID=3155028 RepID=UPI00341B6CBB
MSAQEERRALAPRQSLYDYALQLHRAEPDGRLPQGGYPLPDLPPRQGEGNLGWTETQVAVPEAIVPLLTEPDTTRAAAQVHRRLCALGARDRYVRRVTAELPVADETTARALGRRLTRAGTSTAAVTVGIGLLARLGEPEDVPYLKVLGLLRGFTAPAVEALSTLDCSTAALVWLADCASTRELRHLVDALAGRDDEAVHRGLSALPLGPRAASPSQARRIAEAVRLADVLRRDPVDPDLLAQAGRLLSRMTSVRDYRSEVLAYPHAVAAYDALVTRAAQLPPTLDHYAILLSLALDLHSGPSALLDWPPGHREELLNTLESVLHTPAWAAVLAVEPTDPALRHRTHWARRATGQPFTRRTEPTRLRIEPTVRDPADPDVVETRILLDGRPLVPEAFGRGSANSPEHLLDSGRLRATDEPHEVQLAEAYCTEGCCGALYVTICREGNHVVWRDWSRPPAPPSQQPPPDLPEYRFDAAAYDAEITRAENDRSWAWPARTTARLITAGLRARPELLIQWDAQLGWVGTDYTNPDTTQLSFVFRPGFAAGHSAEDGPWLQFIWNLPDDGTPPQERAEAALQRLATADPKRYAKVAGGRREDAESLGYPWPGKDNRK